MYIHHPYDDDDDQYENLIYCAFGKWYGENGNFEQLSKDEATGNGEQEPTSNDITNEKMEDFFLKNGLECYWTVQRMIRCTAMLGYKKY